MQVDATDPKYPHSPPAEMRRSSSVVVHAAFSNVMRHLLDTHCVTRVALIEFIMYRFQNIYF